MAVAKGKYRWYNDKNELMLGSISHKPGIYCYQETADRRYDCMDYRKEIIKMLGEIENQKILRYIYIIIADIYNDLRR